MGQSFDHLIFSALFDMQDGIGCATEQGLHLLRDIILHMVDGCGCSCGYIAGRCYIAIKGKGFAEDMHSDEARVMLLRQSPSTAPPHWLSASSESATRICVMDICTPSF